MKTFACVALAAFGLLSPLQAAQVQIQAPDPAKRAPAYIQLQRDVLINADLWSDKPQILAANYGFEGIIGVPGVLGADNLPLAVAAGAGVNLDFAALDPEPPLRNLTSAASPIGVVAAGFGAAPRFADAMPIEVSWPLLPSSVAPENIAITLNTGEIVHPVAAALNPNYDHNERHVIVVFGEFGNRLSPDKVGAVYPTTVAFVDGQTPLMAVGPDGPVSIVGLSAPSSNPYVAGPALVGAKLSRFSPAGDFPPPALANAFPNDAFSLYGSVAQYRLRLFTSGGFSPDGVSGFLPTDFETYFRLHARDAQGNNVVLDKAGQVYDLGAGKVSIIGLAEVGPPAQGTPDLAYYAEDHDNYFDIVLQGDEAAVKLLQSVEIPTARFAGYSDIYNPGGPGRTLSPDTIYTKPALPQVYPIDHSLDQLRTVSYASQTLADYDLDTDLPVVFRLQAGDRADLLTSSSKLTNQLIDTEGYTLAHVEFANETDRPAVSAVIGYVSDTGDRFYTLDPAEQATLDADADWTREGRAFGAFDTAWPGLAPVYRFFDPSTKRHTFTPDPNFGRKSGKAHSQGIAWHSALFIKPEPFSEPTKNNSGGNVGWLTLGLGLVAVATFRRRRRVVSKGS